MPLRDTDDIHKRMRGASKPEQPKQRLIDDFSPGRRQAFPNVGSTLSSHWPLNQPVPSNLPRPRQPRPRMDFQPNAPEAATAELALEAPALPVAEQLPAPALRQALPKKTKRKRRLFTKKRIIIALILLILAGGGWYAYGLLSNIQKVFHGDLFSVLTTTKLRGENTGRVNILIAGNSADDPGHDGANLTDSIMIASIDVKDHTAFMISVPRDLWVAIPGYGHAKINEAYYDGQTNGFSAAGYPKGGMGLLEETIYQTLGVKADYYALIDYAALRDGVNAVGGVDYVVRSDDPRGLYDPSIDYMTHGPLVNLTNGKHHLNGEQALDLARARGDAYGSYGFARSDFDRTQHQRELILALKSKVLSAGTFANPVTVAHLFDTVGRHVRTDFSLSEVHRLYDIGHGIDNNKIQSIGLNDVQGKNLLANYLSPVHSSALIPAAGLDDFTDIQALIKQLLSTNPVVREAARVVVLNGTDTSGVAAKAKTALEAKGVTVTAIGDAQASQNVSTIIDASNGGMPATLDLLKRLYGTHITKSNPYASLYDADFIVIVGKNSLSKTASTP